MKQYNNALRDIIEKESLAYFSSFNKVIPCVNSGVLKVASEHKGSQAIRRNDMASRKLELVSYSVFVDNLPQSMSKECSWQLFNHEGKVVDVFMCWKRRKVSSSPFAFVRYTHLK